MSTISISRILGETTTKRPISHSSIGALGDLIAVQETEVADQLGRDERNRRRHHRGADHHVGNFADDEPCNRG